MRSQIIRDFISILRLSRSGNVLFLIVLQAVSYFYILQFDLEAARHVAPVMWALILGTMFIAAGGYLINDYFDINTDKYNKPQRVALIQAVGKRQLILYHIVFTVIGLSLGIYAALEVGKLRLISIQLFCALCLFLYSFVFKRKLLIGNIIIATLSVLSLLIIPAYAYVSMILVFLLKMMPSSLIQVYVAVTTFSFVLTLIREIIKDAEDIKGDISTGCRTLPIVIGTKNTNVIVIILGVISMVLYYIYFSPILMGALPAQLAFILFEVLMIITIVLTAKARLSKDYAQISDLLKLSMAYGLFTSIPLMFYV